LDYPAERKWTPNPVSVQRSSHVFVLLYIVSVAFYYLESYYTFRFQLSKERFGLDRGVSQSRAQKGWGRGG
jgi:hypothetical protein